MIAAVVLAAGMSARMGKPKQTMHLDGVPMLGRVLEVLRRTRVDQTVVVLGAGADKIRSQVKMTKEKVVINPAPRKGMSESLKLGIRSVEREADAVLVVLADQPFLMAKTVDRLIDTYVESHALVVVPVHRGHRGNPVLFDRAVYPQIMKIEGDVGAKSVVEGNKDNLVAVEVDDEGVLTDLDTPSDYERATASQSRGKRIRGST
jgi:molybdenum cofactor cytidylyltransferase